MTLAGVAARNLLRNRFRTVATAIAIALVVVLLVILRTVLWCWHLGSELAAGDRIVTRNRVTSVVPLPRRYADDVRAGVPDVQAATFMNWFGGKDPKDETDWFASMAVDLTFFDVYDEMQVAPEVFARWRADRRGAIVGAELLARKGWKPGDKVVLLGTEYPGEWEFTIAGTYTATRQTVDRASFWFHWRYLDETVPARDRGRIGWVTSRVKDPSRVAETVRAIDRLFAERDVQTFSQSERAFNRSLLGNYDAILTAVDVVSLACALIMALILGNTIAMGVRERTVEYGVLRALGFLPRQLGLLVVIEGAALGLAGGLAGVALAWPVVGALGRVFEERMTGFFPYFRVPPSAAALVLAAAVGLGVVGALVPALRALRIDVTAALRRVG